MRDLAVPLRRSFERINWKRKGRQLSTETHKATIAPLYPNDGNGEQAVFSIVTSTTKQSAALVVGHETMAADGRQYARNYAQWTSTKARLAQSGTKRLRFSFDAATSATNYNRPPLSSRETLLLDPRWIGESYSRRSRGWLFASRSTCLPIPFSLSTVLSPDLFFIVVY